MCPKKDARQREEACNKIIPQIKKVIRDFDDKVKLENEPNYRNDNNNYKRTKFANEPNYQDDTCPRVKCAEEPYPQKSNSCNEVKFANKAKYQNNTCPLKCENEENYRNEAPCPAKKLGCGPIKTDPESCLKGCKQGLEMAPTPLQALDCHYPTEDRMAKPLITFNGLTDIRYTTDKDKALYESGVGVRYQLINVKPEIEAPWCKRNGLQDYWMEDPKYARKSVDIYSTPYPCCTQQMRPMDRNAAPPRVQKTSLQPQGWECCAENKKYLPQGLPQGNCESPRKNKPRDIAPILPRERDMDWKINCNSQNINR